MANKTKKLKKLRKKMNKIYNSEKLDYRAKYNRIFSEEISKEIYSEISLDYYDPDTSYEEDVTAFVNAFNTYMDENYD